MKHGVGQTQSSDCVESHCSGSTDTAWGHFAYSFLVLELNFLQRYEETNKNPNLFALFTHLFVPLHTKLMMMT